MIKVLGLNENIFWDEIVKSFPQYDVYYLSGYVKAFYLHGDGFPQLLYYVHDGVRAIYVYMRRNITQGLFDSITPYGYGGVLFDGILSPKELNNFKEEYYTFMNSEHIIDNFVRYHPILQNDLNMKNISNVIYLGKTIALDLSSLETIWNNITSKNRNMIRKAEKNGVEIKHSKDFGLFNDFIRIYNSTMEHDNANNYYFFEKKFYKSIHEDLYDNFEMFYALYQGNIIAMSIILYANNQMHYHLSGSLYEYRNLAPSNLLLYKAAIWGNEHGFKTFHLGGGVGSKEDSLYRFKSAFNRNSNYHFSIGKEIFDNIKYERLVNERKMHCPEFDTTSSFFPLYRS